MLVVLDLSLPEIFSVLGGIIILSVNMLFIFQRLKYMLSIYSGETMSDKADGQVKM